VIGRQGAAVAGLAAAVREKFLLAECRIRIEPFVYEARGGRRGRRDKEPWDDAVPDLVR
jgi:hypothetical protein